MNDDRYYQSWPDFTVGDSEADAARCFAHSIDLMSNDFFAQDAVMFMKMVAFGIKEATNETPYIVEAGSDESKYFQVIRGANQEYYLEIAAPEAAGRQPDQVQREALGQLGWVMPNQDSPNYHREYQVGSDRYGMAADAAKGWFTAYKA